MFGLPVFKKRFMDNVKVNRWDEFHLAPITSNEYFKKHECGDRFDGYIIDGDHDAPHPLEDAQNSARFANPSCVILFHDFIGRPLRAAVRWLMESGWKCRVYYTPHMVALCWRGFGDDRPRGHEGFMAPVHRTDPHLLRQLAPHLEQMLDFDFTRCV